MIVGRPKRSRPTQRVNYNLDTSVRAILTEIADSEGRNEGAQVEQMILFYAAVKQLTAEGVAMPLTEIESRKAQIWKEILITI